MAWLLLASPRLALSLHPVPPVPSVRPASHCLSFAPTFPYGITAPTEPLHYKVLQYGQFPLGTGPCRCYCVRVTDPPSHPMDRLPIKPFAAIALGCLLGFGLVDLARQDKRALAHCEQRGGSVAECRLVVLGR